MALTDWQKKSEDYFEYDGVTFYKNPKTGQWTPQITPQQQAFGDKDMLQKAQGYATVLNQGGPQQLMGMGGGIGNLSGSQIYNLTQNQLNEATLGRQRDEADLVSLEGEYSGIPDVLRQRYTDMAKQAGTYGDTNEFKAGLESDVRAGARGAQAVMESRINALRQRLGKEAMPGTSFAPQGGAQLTPVTANSPNLVSDKNEPVASNKPVDVEPTAEPQAVDNNETKNAVTSLQSKQSALKKKVSSF